MSTEIVVSEIFEWKFQVGWRDVDPNGHVANMAYMEYAVDTRIAFFASRGFKPNDFLRQGFGPVIKNDFVEYFRELVMLDSLTVTMENGGHSEDLSRFRVINNIHNSDGAIAARVTSIGGWLGHKERKLIEPPDAIRKAWFELRLTEDFEHLSSSLKK